MLDHIFLIRMNHTECGRIFVRFELMFFYELSRIRLFPLFSFDKKDRSGIQQTLNKIIVEALNVMCRCESLANLKIGTRL